MSDYSGPAPRQYRALKPPSKTPRRHSNYPRTPLHGLPTISDTTKLTASSSNNDISTYTVITENLVPPPLFSSGDRRANTSRIPSPMASSRLAVENTTLAGTGDDLYEGGGSGLDEELETSTLKTSTGGWMGSLEARMGPKPRTPRGRYMGSLEARMGPKPKTPLGQQPSTTGAGIRFVSTPVLPSQRKEVCRPSTTSVYHSPTTYQSMTSVEGIETNVR